MPCCLRAFGRDFDVGGFCKTSTLEVSTIYRKGEPKYPASQPDGPRLDISGLIVVLDNSGFDSIEPQIAASREYLNAHWRELRRLAKYPGVDGVFVDFSVESLDDTCGQCERIPADVVKCAARAHVGIAITVY